MTRMESAGVRPMTSEQRIIRHLRTIGGPATRRTIARDLDLPPTTVARIVARLVSAGDVEQVLDDSDHDRSGRPPSWVRIVGEVSAIGLLTWDRDRVTTSVVAFSGAQLAASEHLVGERPTGFGALAAAVDSARDMAAAHPARVRLHGVVLSIPAPFLSDRSDATPAPTGPAVVFPPWLDHDPSDALTARLGVPVIVENNANLAALGEAGEHPGCRTLIYLRVGHRSLGAGIVLDGRLHRGASGFAGELAHVQAVEGGALCMCGARGCIATVLRASNCRTGETFVDFVDAARQARAGHAGAGELLTDVGRLLGRQLAGVCTLLDPDGIVVGGRLGDAAAWVVAGVREQIDLHTTPIVSRGLRVSVSTLGLAAETLGAIDLARSRL